MPTYESLPAESPYFNGNLFRKMVDDLRLAGKAKRTVYGYLRAVRKLADFCQKSPDLIREQDVRRYLPLTETAEVDNRQVINWLFALPPENDKQSGGDGKQ